MFESNGAIYRTSDDSGATNVSLHASSPTAKDRWKLFLKLTETRSFYICFQSVTVLLFIILVLIFNVKISIMSRQLEELTCVVCVEPSYERSLREIGLVCCREKMTYLQRIAEKLKTVGLSHLINEELGSSRAAHRQCSAHLTLQSDPGNVAGIFRKYQNVYGWSADDPASHIVHDCIEHDDNFGTFTVLVSGSYLVYSHLSFTPSIDLIGQVYSHNLSQHPLIVGQKIISNNYVILRQSRAVHVPAPQDLGGENPQKVFDNLGCGDDTGSLHTSTIVGVFHLNAGDTLTVQALPSVWLCRWKESSYFGFSRITT